MRTILFFDLPSVTLTNKRNYRKFVKNLKKTGFVMLQESVYYMLSINQQYANSKLNTIKAFLPPDGNILALTITEKQFSSMEILLGESKSDVVTTDERLLIF